MCRCWYQSFLDQVDDDGVVGGKDYDISCLDFLHHDHQEQQFRIAFVWRRSTSSSTATKQKIHHTGLIISINRLAVGTDTTVRHEPV
jgi:hypothetical protein